jgi:hypothetical protein
MNERIKELVKTAKADCSGKWVYTNSLEDLIKSVVLDCHQYVDGLDTAQVISDGLLRRYGIEAVK